MAQLLEDNQEEKPKKKKWSPKIDGRFGVSFMFASREIFMGFSISQADVPELVKVRRRILPGKGKVFNL